MPIPGRGLAHQHNTNYPQDEVRPAFIRKLHSSISVRNCQIFEEGARWFVDAMEHNTTLSTFDLRSSVFVEPTALTCTVYTATITFLMPCSSAFKRAFAAMHRHRALPWLLPPRNWELARLYDSLSFSLLAQFGCCASQLYLIWVCGERERN